MRISDMPDDDDRDEEAVEVDMTRSRATRDNASAASQMPAAQKKLDDIFSLVRPK
jgi:hypothetical protein